MRIAYVAPYQGQSLLARRPIRINLALAANLKVELVAELLTRRQHEVEILSQGEVVENRFEYYQAYEDTQPGDPPIRVSYASALPVRYINGWWSTQRTLAQFKSRHKQRPFDLVLLYNLKQPQVACAIHAIERLRLPVVVEYEDDRFVDVRGQVDGRLVDRGYLRRARQVIDSASAGVCVSPHLLSEFGPDTPGLLLRGVISDEIVNDVKRAAIDKENKVVYSGTFAGSKGLVPLVTAWVKAPVPGWELHLAGDGVLAGVLREMAAGCPSIRFLGLLDRKENSRLLNSARICINPHDLSATPGNVFAFKIIEYLAAGSHVLTTPMGELEGELERGITYMAANDPETIADSLHRAVRGRQFEATASDAAIRMYGPEAVADSLDRLLRIARPDRAA